MIIGKITSVDYDKFRVKVLPEIRSSSVNIAGDMYYFGNIGSYLKVKNALGEEIVSEVVSIFDSDQSKDQSSFDIDGIRELLLKPVGTINSKSKFQLGIGIYPSIYSDVSIVTNDDMRVILDSSSETYSEKVHSDFYIGTSKNLINYPINIGINNFFNIHTAILGNSGSGKSNTISHILQEIHKKEERSASGSRILIFDVNGEYKYAFPKSKNSDLDIKYYKPNISADIGGFKPFSLPHFLLNIDEWSGFLIASEATQKPFWDKVLQESYRFYRIISDDPQEQERFAHYFLNKLCRIVYSILDQADSDTASITAASSILSSIEGIINSDINLRNACNQTSISNTINTFRGNLGLSFGNNNGALRNAVEQASKDIDFNRVLEVENYKLPHGNYFDYKFLELSARLTLLEEDAKGNRRIREYTSTLLSRLDYFLYNSDCEFMRTNHMGGRDAASYLNNLWDLEGDNHKTQMVIIDTSELPPDALETLTSVVSRVIFSDRKSISGEKRREKPVHLILDEAHRYIHKDQNYILNENIFERIAREGRKYSLYLMVSSQRPSELSQTVLSQCSNFIIHRIQNELDMRYIHSILPFFSDDFTLKVKQSTPGECLIFGNCVSMPLHVKIAKANPEPNSKNCDIAKEWFKEKPQAAVPPPPIAPPPTPVPEQF